MTLEELMNVARMVKTSLAGNGDVETVDVAEPDVPGGPPAIMFTTVDGEDFVLELMPL